MARWGKKVALLATALALFGAWGAPAAPRAQFSFQASVSNLIARFNVRWDGLRREGGLAGRELFRSKSHDAFAQAKTKLALIVTGTKAGSGFLVRDGGRAWLVTNAHVVRGEARVHATMLDGTALALGPCEYASGRDLARFPLTGVARPALELRRGLPDVGERITVLGNTDGRGVVTEIKGAIVGVGPLEIEVDAPFTVGNSGSPVLDRSGRVVAVASYLRDCRNDKDWSKRNTRFNGIRRFAIRLQGAKWQRR